MDVLHTVHLHIEENYIYLNVSVYSDLIFYHFKCNVETLPFYSSLLYFSYHIYYSYIHGKLYQKVLSFWLSTIMHTFMKFKKRKIAYYIYTDIYIFVTLSSFLMFQVTPWNHFLSIWRTSFISSFRAYLLVMNALIFHSSENIFISVSFLKVIFTTYRIHSEDCLNTLKMCSCFHGFWWEIFSHLNVSPYEIHWFSLMSIFFHYFWFLAV